MAEEIIREKRADMRSEYSEEISFELLLVEGGKRSIAFRRGCTVDIGHGGLGLMTTHKSKKGEIVKLSMRFSDREVTLPVLAEVMWVTPFNESYRTGLRFLA